MKHIFITVRILFFLTILTGFIYPALVTGIAWLFFREKSNGSIIYKNNDPVGSVLIGQRFDTSIYFTSRPSSTGYNSLPSGGSNYGLTNVKLKKNTDERIANFRIFNMLDSMTDVPAEMVFSSASGLDPHISVKAALMQVNRIALTRKFSDLQKKSVYELIKKHTEPPQFRFMGEERINVLLLNLDLDKIK
jgi:K+-transporting ATPase ATPase C chain